MTLSSQCLVPEVLPPQERPRGALQSHETLTDVCVGGKWEGLRQGWEQSPREQKGFGSCRGPASALVCSHDCPRTWLLSCHSQSVLLKAAREHL